MGVGAGSGRVGEGSPVRNNRVVVGRVYRYRRREAYQRMPYQCLQPANTDTMAPSTPLNLLFLLRLSHAHHHAINLPRHGVYLGILVLNNLFSTFCLLCHVFMSGFHSAT